MNTLWALFLVASSEVQGRVVDPPTLQDLVQASDVVIIGEREPGTLWSVAPLLVLLLVPWRRKRFLLAGVFLCASCMGGSSAGGHFPIRIKKVLYGTCSEPSVDLVVPAAGACYEPEVLTRTEYLMFLRKSDGEHYTTSWVAHSLLPVENGSVKATWRSEHGKELRIEELQKRLE